MREKVWGDFRISRRLTDSGDHFLWDCDDAFCPRSAWIDCIARAAYKSHHRKVGNQSVEIPRGCFLASVRSLANDWRWSRRRVHAYLSLLVDENMLEAVESNRTGTLYRVVNYDTYQYSRDSSGDRSGTEAGQKRDALKNQREPRETKDIYPKRARARGATETRDDDGDSNVQVDGFDEDDVEPDPVGAPGQGVGGDVPTDPWQVEDPVAELERTDSVAEKVRLLRAAYAQDNHPRGCGESVLGGLRTHLSVLADYRGSDLAAAVRGARGRAEDGRFPFESGQWNLGAMVRVRDLFPELVSEGRAMTGVGNGVHGEGGWLDRLPD